MRKGTLVLCMLLLICSMGCSKEKKVKQPSTTILPEVTKTVTESGEIGIQVYTTDMDSMQSVNEIVYFMKGEEIQASSILKKVLELFKANTIDIKVNDIKQKEDVMYVSFAKDSVPVVAVSKKVEEIILESIAKSLVDNLEDVEKIVFQVDGGAYKSENLELGEDEAYWWK